MVINIFSVSYFHSAYLNNLFYSFAVIFMEFLIDAQQVISLKRLRLKNEAEYLLEGFNYDWKRSQVLVKTIKDDKFFCL